MNKDSDFFIKKYLKNQPSFMSYIRVPEAMLFSEYSRLIKRPVLDFGPGDGFFAKTVFGTGLVDCGLDIKNDRTKHIFGKKIYKKILFYEGTKIPIKNNSYNTVISNCVLEHIPDIETSLREIYRILKPRGLFITSVMTDKWNDYLYGKKFFGKFYERYMRKIQFHENLFSYSKWSAVFRKSKFGIVTVRGYMDMSSSQHLDIAHYLSAPSLLSKIIFGKWQKFPNLNQRLWNKSVAESIDTNVPVRDSAALFFILKK